MATSESGIPAAESLPREALIDTAIRFLTNPNVVDRPFHQKQSFLKSKGMTDEEIRISCERSNVQVSVPHQSQGSVIPMYGVPQHVVVPQQSSVWIRLRDFMHTLALLGGFGYVIYWIYKSYIEPFLFGRPKPKKSAEESLSSIEEAVTNVSRSTSELRSELRSELSRISHERESGAVRTLAEIKSDIATVKGLLLNRQQFPSAPTTATLRTGLNVKPTIPAWQMSTEQRNSSQEDQEQNGNKVSQGASKSLSMDSSDVNGHSTAANEDNLLNESDTNGSSLSSTSNGSALMSEVVPE
ncbi:peroxisomal membrane protein PEX14 [Thrips palmi]|uniref:Peroxisomal membrane protein PEX14 n=1 Tax=Thrips palmi TaxID=161013 RepID=A0A6P8Z6G9_THRPL|nr:peroxisomal membrane protein PEX14 [Thrips palmi]